MTIAYNNLSSLASDTDGAVTESVGPLVPTSGSVVFVAVGSQHSSYEQPTVVDDCGISSWEYIAFSSNRIGAASSYYYHCWWGTTGSPTTGSIIISASGADTFNRVLARVFEFTGMDTTIPVPQTASIDAYTESPGVQSSSFASAMDGDSACLTLATVMAGGSYNIATQSGFTAAEETFLNGVARLVVHYKIGTATQVEADFGSTVSVPWAVFGVELAAAGGGSPPAPPASGPVPIVMHIRQLFGVS